VRECRVEGPPWWQVGARARARGAARDGMRARRDACVKERCVKERCVKERGGRGGGGTAVRGGDAW
jgi:hypothetical protein